LPYFIYNIILKTFYPVKGKKQLLISNEQLAMKRKRFNTNPQKHKNEEPLNE